MRDKGLDGGHWPRWYVGGGQRGHLEEGWATRCKLPVEEVTRLISVASIKLHISFKLR